MSFAQLPANPPTSLDAQTYFEHRKLLYSYARMSIFVPEPTGVAAQDTANINAAISAAINTKRGGTIVLGNGDYAINGTILIRDVQGLSLIGQGHRTRLVWSGDDALPVIKLAHARESLLSSFVIMANGSYAGVQCLRDNAPNGLSPTKNRFERILIDSAANGVVFGGTGAVDANNDFNVCEDVVVNGYSNVGFWIAHSQSYGNLFKNCHALGLANVSQYGLSAGGVAGGFIWQGGSMFANELADFRIGRSYQPNLIDGVNSENSKRFLVTSSNSYCQLSVKNSRYAGNQLHADGQAIITTGTMQLLMEQCSIGDGANPTNATTINLSANTLASIRFMRLYSSAVDAWSGKTPDEVFFSKKITDEVGGIVVDLTTTG